MDHVDLNPIIWFPGEFISAIFYALFFWSGVNCETPRRSRGLQYRYRCTYSIRHVVWTCVSLTYCRVWDEGQDLRLWNLFKSNLFDHKHNSSRTAPYELLLCLPDSPETKSVAIRTLFMYVPLHQFSAFYSRLFWNASVSDEAGEKAARVLGSVGQKPGEYLQTSICPTQ
jgi:hypothetical protein